MYAYRNAARKRQRKLSQDSGSDKEPTAVASCKVETINLNSPKRKSTDDEDSDETPLSKKTCSLNINNNLGYKKESNISFTLFFSN